MAGSTRARLSNVIGGLAVVVGLVGFWTAMWVEYFAPHQPTAVSAVPILVRIRFHEQVMTVYGPLVVATVYRWWFWVFAGLVLLMPVTRRRRAR